MRGLLELVAQVSAPISAQQTLAAASPEGGADAQAEIRALSEHLAANGGAEARLVSLELPAGLLAALTRDGIGAMRSRAGIVWEQPGAESALFGFGEAMRLAGPRSSPMTAAMAGLRQAAAKAVVRVENPTARPRFFGGGRFSTQAGVVDTAWDGFGGWEYTAPQILVAMAAGRVSGSYTALVAPGATPAAIEAEVRTALGSATNDAEGATGDSGDGHAAYSLSSEDWMARVAEAIREISNGAYEKVVLARRARAGMSASGGIGAVLGRLADRYPNCFVFKYRGDRWDWIGASPELLVTLDSGHLRTASLAGSRPRVGDETEDGRLAAELLADPKERSEHEYVVIALREALTPLCDDLHGPNEPVVMSLANIHHLYTPFAGEVKRGVDVLDLVTAMHPTPAIGAWPKAEGLAAIGRLEEMDRGWYSGPIGWMDFAGDGEFAVALRTGLVGREGAILFAGVGIVEGSVPAREFAETEAKFRPLREALAGS